MTQPDGPKPGFAREGEARQRKSHSDTMLLSEVPDAASLIAEANYTPPAFSSPTLSSNALAALAQRYDILADAGHGSMGNVYKARDRETGETVALKLLKPEIASDQAMMDRFKNELLFARKITHKNVCRVHDFNRIAGIAYTSMEFVEGESLRSVLNRFGGLRLRKAIDVSLQICSGLKEAHAQGIVHRDLKPENVMVDVQGNVKIMDFGIARSMEAATRLTGSLVGTPAYMAPEQVGGKAVDYRTDIYSLGLMLYEMFTGAQAFQADSPVAVALKQIRETPAPPHEVEPRIPVPVEHAILKCLEKEPARRFQSVAELEQVLSAPTALGNPMASAVAMPSRVAHTTSSAAVLSIPGKAEPGRTSAVAWLLLGALTVLAGLAGGRWYKTVQSAEQIPAPARLPAPKPPDFAFTIPASAPSAEAPAKPAHSAAAAPPAAVAPAEVFPKREYGRANRAPKSSPGSVPPDIQQRAEKAFGQNAPGAAGERSTYLWVGRFAKEERAQSAAKKIEDLGLPVTVIPRHGVGGKFFIVVTGPFGDKRVSSVTQWLESQGFSDVHPFTLSMPNRPAP
jgi:Protein kinase domain/SPOR domain